MTTYIYYCPSCDSAFEVDADDTDGGAPLETACPKCGNERAKKAFAAERSQPSTGTCKPDGSC